ncbi:MAG TPA: DUF2240 family protein [Thermoplasmata archaeon]|nr:DUF2240 family protein [Thermoplasmata archaeon]
MDEEPKTALAALFQMRGRDAISETDFVHETSYKLRWFSPKEAQRLLQLGLDRGLLRADGGNLRPSFDLAAVTVPVNYRPGPGLLAPPPRPVDLFSRVLTRLQTATGQDRPPLVARINRMQERLGVDAEVAAAHVACSLGVDVSDLLADLEAEVLRRAR